MFGKRIQQVVCFKDGWEVVDLNYVSELFLIEADPQALVQSVVVLGVLNGDAAGLVHMGLDLKPEINIQTVRSLSHASFGMFMFHNHACVGSWVK